SGTLRASGCIAAGAAFGPLIWPAAMGIGAAQSAVPSSQLLRAGRLAPPQDVPHARRVPLAAARCFDFAGVQLVGNALQGLDPGAADVIDDDPDIQGALGRLGLDCRNSVAVSLAGAPQRSCAVGVAKLDAPALGRSQGLACAVADHAPLMLRQ